MTAQQLSKIERDLGSLSSDVRAVLRELERDRQESKESRKRVYERVERVEETAEIAGKVAAQARDVADGVARLVAEEIKPQTDKLKNLSSKGAGILVGLTFAGSLLSQPIFTALASAAEKIFAK